MLGDPLGLLVEREEGKVDGPTVGLSLRDSLGETECSSVVKPEGGSVGDPLRDRLGDKEGGAVGLELGVTLGLE